MPSVVDEPIYKPHEARIHESVFDTLSQPLLSRANGNSTDNISHGRNSPSPTHNLKWQKSPNSQRDRREDGHCHITWDHFGKKFHIHMSKNELDAGQHDLLELLYRKVHDLVPEFRGHLAYADAFDHEILLQNGHQLRDLLANNRRIHVFTTLTGENPPHLVASELSNAGSRAPSRNEPSGGGGLLKRACDDVAGRKAVNAAESPPLAVGSGHVGAISPVQTLPSGISLCHYPPIGGCCCSQSAVPYPIFIRGSWIGPNKFWGGGGGYWGGIGPIPSGRYWHTAAGGRPPW